MLDGSDAIGLSCHKLRTGISRDAERLRRFSLVITATCLPQQLPLLAFAWDRACAAGSVVLMRVGTHPIGYVCYRIARTVMKMMIAQIGIEMSQAIRKPFSGDRCLSRGDLLLCITTIP